MKRKAVSPFIRLSQSWPKPCQSAIKAAKNREANGKRNKAKLGRKPANPLIPLANRSKKVENVGTFLEVA